MISWLAPDAPIRTRESSVAGRIRVCQACGGELPLRPRDRWHIDGMLLCGPECWDNACDARDAQRAAARA